MVHRPARWSRGEAQGQIPLWPPPQAASSEGGSRVSRKEGDRYPLLAIPVRAMAHAKLEMLIDHYLARCRVAAASRILSTQTGGPSGTLAGPSTSTHIE